MEVRNYPEYPGRGTILRIQRAQSNRMETRAERRNHGTVHCERDQSVLETVYANLDGVRISFELRDENPNAASFVIFVDDPETDIVAEKGGVIRTIAIFNDSRLSERG